MPCGPALNRLNRMTLLPRDRALFDLVSGGRDAGSVAPRLPSAVDGILPQGDKGNRLVPPSRYSRNAVPWVSASLSPLGLFYLPGMCFLYAHD